jgi:multidrug efflux pump
VFSISVSLIAVFHSHPDDGWHCGTAFPRIRYRTLSTAIAVSMVISLTTTPAMCAHLLKPHSETTAACIK